MNSTLSRLGIAVPVAAAIFGWSLSATQAAPYQPSDKIQVQPAEHEWPDDIAIPEPDDVDEPDDPADEPVDEPANEPADEPTEEDEDSDEESDEDSDEDSDDGGQSALAPKNDNDKGSHNGTDSSEPTADTVEAASTTPIAPPFRPAGVQVPLLMVVGAGALLTGVAGWAGYRRYQLYAH